VQHENQGVLMERCCWAGQGFFTPNFVISKMWGFVFPKLVEFSLENTKNSSTQLKKIVEEKQLLSYAAWVNYKYSP